MTTPIHDDECLYDYLGVSEATEIILEALEMDTVSSGGYVARSGNRHAFVSRLLAIRLRTDGASWQGDITRDPCAVA